MLFEELGKIKRTSIMTSIILLALGIVILMCPEQYIDSLVSVLGYGMVTLAIVLILDFISGKKALINYIYLTGALILLLVGIGVLVYENIVLLIGIVFGLVLIVVSLNRIVNTWMYVRRAEREGWWVLILLAVLLLACGLLILINPWWRETAQLFDVIGAALLITSVVSIVRLLIIWPITGEESED